MLTAHREKAKSEAGHTRPDERERARAQDDRSLDNIAEIPMGRSGNPPYIPKPTLIVRSTSLLHTKRLLGAGYYHLQPHPQ